MDADGPASDLVAVEHEVVGAGADGAWVRFEALEIFRERTRERMVGGGKLAVVGALEERELVHPAKLPLARRDDAELVRDVKAERAEHGVHELARAKLKEKNVAFLQAG